MDPFVYLIIIFVCILLSAFFSGSETALMRLRKEHLEKDIEAAKGPAALAVRDLLHSTSRLLITILLGNNLVNIVAASCAAALAVHFLGQQEGIIVASVVMTVVVLIFAEILPKAVAARNPKKISYIIGMPLYIFHQLIKPIHFVFDKVIEPIVRKISKQKGEEPVSKVDELLALARETPRPHRKAGPVAIISGAAAAADMIACDIMIPRTEISAFPVETSATELLDKMTAERYTRYPIYEGSLDTVLGLVHLKEVIKLVRNNKQDIRQILYPVLRVPERKPILDLLANMQQTLTHMAIVKDEFGVTQGLVTQEDILEEIVGEIRDEFDREELSAVQKTGSGDYVAVARIHVSDFNKQSGWSVEAERGDTLSGLVYNTLGRAPQKGDVVDLPEYQITVLDMSGPRIKRVRISRHMPTGSDTAGTSK